MSVTSVSGSASPVADAATSNADAPQAIAPSPPAPVPAASTRKPRARALPPPVNADEAQRRQRFYAELRRHRRAFGIVGARAPAEEELPGEDDGDVADEAPSPDPRSQQTALYMELMEHELGPVEAGDTAFMRGFPRSFATWAEFDAALERYAHGTFQPLRSHSAQATVARNKSTLKYLSAQLIPGTFIGHFYPERFEWYKKVLVCAICRAASTRLKTLARSGGGARSRGPIKDTDAKVTAHLQPEADDSKRFVIDVSWSGAHSHRCDEIELAKFTQGAGRLDDPVLLSLVRRMRQEGKEPRDVKRFIYECTGKKCSTKEVHALYQRMGADSAAAAAADEDSAPDDASLDFLSEDQATPHSLPSAATSAAVVPTLHARNVSPMPMDFEAMQVVPGGRLHLPSGDRSISGVLQNIKLVANVLTSQDQAEFASALQNVVSSWTAKQKRTSAVMAGMVLPSAAVFQFPLPLPQQQQQQQHHQHLQQQPLPSPAGGSSGFEYRRYEDVGADLLMGLDTPDFYTRRGLVEKLKDVDALVAAYGHQMPLLYAELDKKYGTNLSSNPPLIREEIRHADTTTPYTTPVTPTAPPKPQSHKIVLLGNSGVGKTNLLSRLNKGEFSSEFTSTIGVEFLSHRMHLDGVEVKAQIWDTAGQERFHSMMATYYRKAVGALLIFDVRDRQSLLGVEKWLDQLLSVAEPGLHAVLVGNKCDLVPPERVVSHEEAEQFAAAHHMQYIETSAKTGQNVEKAFHDVIAAVHRAHAAEQERAAALSIDLAIDRREAQRSTSRGFLDSCRFA